MTQTLDHRIADAFATDLGSEDLAKLITEVRTAAENARQFNEEAKRIALDPATRPEAVTQARKDGEDATFRATRLDAAIEGLQGLLDKAKDRELRNRNAEEFAAAQAERDELAKDIAEQYPELSSKLAALLARIAASNTRIEAANRLGLGTIDRAERDGRPTERRLPAGHSYGLPVRELVDYVRLPHVDMIHARPDQWPPHNNW